jgi:hypothetical protein
LVRPRVGDLEADGQLGRHGAFAAFAAFDDPEAFERPLVRLARARWVVCWATTATRTETFSRRS